MKTLSLLLTLLLASLALAAPDPGSNLSLAWSREFPALHQAGFRNPRGIRSPIMFGDAVRIILGTGDTIETYLASTGKDGRARSPLLLTLHPGTGETLLTSPTRIRRASPGLKSPQGAYWGNHVGTGELCVNELLDSIVATYGSDHNFRVRFSKFTGEQLPVTVGVGGSNWSGIYVVAPEDDRNHWNGGTAPYNTVEDVFTKPILVRDVMWKASAPLTITHSRLRPTATVAAPLRDVVWSRSFTGHTLVTALTLGDDDRVWFVAYTGGKYHLCGVNSAGEMDVKHALASNPAPTLPRGRIVPPVITATHAYFAESASVGGKLQIRVVAIDLATGSRKDATIPTTVPATVGATSTMRVAASLGLLAVQADTGTHATAVVMLRGDKTPATIPAPQLPATGYVELKPVDFTLPTTGMVEVIAPTAIANPNPLETHSYAKAPKFRIAFSFPKTRGSKVYLRVPGFYIADSRVSKPTDHCVWAFHATWPTPSTRKNIPIVIGTPIARRNVGAIASNRFVMDFDVTAYVNAQEGAFGLCMEATEFPYLAQCGKNIDAQDVRLIVCP